MSARTMIALRSASVGRAAVTTRGLAFSATQRLGLKESASQTDPNYEKHKHDSLDKQRRGAGHWKPELASDSEEAVKADRNAHESAAELQEKTKRAAEENAKSGTSVRDGM
ncbi:hypothetical protein N3K66_003042 [Trichothecium roseum]|uniref:Uncharacterized protein n=1 Tax=Trichothecium roseum TaxID=47278 RepID=A0ACC0V446_9HYPO|nr:hypothetical protein N3K66_003042 [Trichothecium roseum]